MTEVRVRTRPAPTQPAAEPQVRERKRTAAPAAPEVRVRSRPEPKPINPDTLGIAVTCGVCRATDDAIGPVIGHFFNSSKTGKTTAYAYSGGPADQRSSYEARECDGQDAAMTFLRERHEARGCAGKEPKKAKPKRSKTVRVRRHS